MFKLNDEDKKYFQSIWKKIDNKMEKVAVRSYDKIPYTAHNGVHNNSEYLNEWTNGFWPGMMWILYEKTRNEQYMKTAVNAQNKLRAVFTDYTDELHHDVGFMWNISSGVHYRINGDKQAKCDALIAANTLASRYNIKGGYIRAWNRRKEVDRDHNKGWAIIDCMMNLPVLYRATEITGDERFSYIAMAHADKTMKYHVREDGSLRHIVEYNPSTGEFVCDYGGQGYELGSSWSRGQAWGLYGFVLNYVHTKEEKYLDTAKRIANYFISCVASQKDFLPLCDFRAPETPVIYDSTAGCCAASGLIEIANHVPQHEKPLYLNAAIKLLKAITDKFVDFSEDTDPLVNYGTEAYHRKEGHHIPIIYADYFYIECIYKLISDEKGYMLFW